MLEQLSVDNLLSSIISGLRDLTRALAEILGDVNVLKQEIEHVQSTMPLDVPAAEIGSHPNNVNRVQEKETSRTPRDFYGGMEI